MGRREKRQDAGHNKAAAACLHHCFKQLVRPALDNGVPHRVEQCGPEYDENNKCGHAVTSRWRVFKQEQRFRLNMQQGVAMNAVGMENNLFPRQAVQGVLLAAGVP